VFLGKILGVSDDGEIGFVQVKGVYADLAYSGTAPVRGWPVQMSGDGTVDKEISAGITSEFTLSVNATASTCDILL